MAKKKKNLKVRLRGIPGIKGDNLTNDSDSVLDDDNSMFSLAISNNSAKNGSLRSYDDFEMMDDSLQLEDHFEDKLETVLDNLQNTKASAKSRLAQFEALSNAIKSRFCDEFFIDR